MALQFINQVGQSSKIYYDDEVCNYVKVYAKHAWYTRRGIKRALGILLTPDKNMEYITQRLLQAGIHCPELVDIEDYKVTFKECKNTQTLREYRAVHGHNALRVEQIEIFAQLFKADLLHADPHDSNFLYDGEKIIVIDVDALVCSPWKFLPRQLVLYRIWRHSACDYDFADLVAQRWKDRTIFQRLVNNIYTLRTYLKVHLLKKKEKELIFLKHINKYLHEVHQENTFFVEQEQVH